MKNLRKLFIIMLLVALCAPYAFANASSVDDIMNSDVPIAYGDEQFRQRILARTEGKRSPVGLVLSGGSARAMAHIGVLRYLEEKGIVPDYIISNSMGSIVGLLYAAGMSPDQIEKVILNSDFGKRLDFTLPLQGGLLRADTLAELAASYLGKPLRLENLEIPIIVVQEDLVTKRQIQISEGDFAQVFLSSFSIPVYFPPVEYKGHLLIDGGITNLAPVDLAFKYSDDVIVSTTFYSVDNLNLRNPLTNLNIAFDIQKRRSGIIEMKRNPSLIWIRCMVEKDSFMDFDNIKEISQKGYEAAKAVDDQLAKVPQTKGLESLTEKRAYFNETLNKGISNYFLFSHVHKSTGYSVMGFDSNSFVNDSRSFLKENSTFGLDYRLEWGNFSTYLLGGLSYATFSNEYFRASPELTAGLDYYAFNHVKASVLVDFDWDSRSLTPSFYVRQNIEARFKLLNDHFLIRGVEGFESLHGEARLFGRNTLLLNAGLDGSYLDGIKNKGWNLAGSRLGVYYQVLGDYLSFRSFVSLKSDVVLDAMPTGMFFSMRNTFRFALDEKGDVPLFTQDGFRTNSNSLRTKGHNLITPEGNPSNFLAVASLHLGYRPINFKPSFSELVILNNASISAYLDLLWAEETFLPALSTGLQMDITTSFLGLKDFPFSIYCGYDQAVSSVVWGFFLGNVIS
ncbi:MAG: patatin-like phospholipase family protein [Sphaerochaetaceae bacterium]